MATSTERSRKARELASQLQAHRVTVTLSSTAAMQLEQLQLQLKHAKKPHSQRAAIERALGAMARTLKPTPALLAELRKP